MRRPQPIQFSLAALLMTIPFFALYFAWMRLPPLIRGLIANVLAVVISMSGPVAFCAVSFARFIHKRLVSWQVSRKSGSSQRDRLERG